MGRIAGMIIAAAAAAAAVAQTTGTWKSTGYAPYPVNRSELQGEEIEGKFYTVGGQCECPGGGPSIDLYIYDVAGNSWTKGADMPAKRHHPATAAHGGKFYVLGGINQELGSWPWDRGEQNNWVYDPKTNRWDTLPSIPERFGAGDAEAVGGKIYIAGGILEGENIARTRTWEYDIATRTWTKKANMVAAREHFRMAAIGNRIYAAAGRHDHKDVKIFEAYDIPTDKWVQLKDLPTTRGGVAVGAVNGRVYVMGGEGANASIGLFKHVEEYDPLTDTWKRMADMPLAMHGMAGIVYDGKMWTVAGSNPFGHQPKNVVYSFSPGYTTDVIAPKRSDVRLAVAPAAGALSVTLPYDAFVKLTFFDAAGAVTGATRTGLLPRGDHALGAVPAGSGFVRAVIDGAAGRRETQSARVDIPR